ncbi:hypothetical protein D187_008009 [Cystobacter fuscus DSM 2262]|uniref:Uncharacterized protein n=1 Tax=Cystobacter fuscus (strain ATCC 25194 / DSM 2262 / NBRC 100088 / M29) TaxID=1242864 RepID=S9P350_CYSF2|nr:hypothetical protein D187_008009 [Cystobacter fuscus DSM 2262]
MGGGGHRGAREGRRVAQHAAGEGPARKRGASARKWRRKPDPCAPTALVLAGRSLPS